MAIENLCSDLQAQGRGWEGARAAARSCSWRLLPCLSLPLVTTGPQACPPASTLRALGVIPPPLFHNTPLLASCSLCHFSCNLLPAVTWLWVSGARTGMCEQLGAGED